jgi:replicative DNA helicase
MYAQGPVKGERHTIILRLSSWLKRTGISSIVTSKILIDWASAEINDPSTSFSETEITKIVNNVYDKGYSYWCNDVLMSKYCESKCVYYSHRENSSIFKNNEQVSEEFIDWFMGFNYDDSVDIGKFCGSHKSWWANPKELIVLSGDSGAGKSAFMQNLMLKSGIRTAYYQMEMGEELDRLRFNKMHFDMEDVELRAHFDKMSRPELIESQKIFDNIFFKSSAPSIDHIKKEVAMFNPKIIVIDTMDMIVSNARSRLDQQRDIIVKLKKLALELNCIVFAVAHKTKSSSDVSSEYYNNNNNAIAGDGAIFQKADKILFVTTPRGQIARERLIISSKNRNEGLLEEKMMFIGEKMIYKPAQ